MLHLATKTLEAIEQAVARDGGASYRGVLRKLMPLAEDAYNEKESDFRAHLGASLIGRVCERELWYSFRWVTLKKFAARMVRLFNRGHLEEPRMVALLTIIGCTVYQFDANGKQFRIYGYKGHYGGGLDSVVVNCPDVPQEPVLGEFKTHNDASFKNLKKVGVKEAKFEHFVQMQEYMGYNKLRFALYLATNKNDDDLYGEIVAFDPIYFQRTGERVIRIVDAYAPPARVPNAGPAWHECKFCDHKPVCLGKTAAHKSCRSCMWIEVQDGGRFMCHHKDRQIAMLFPEVDPAIARPGEDFFPDEARQLAACKFYEANPHIKA